MAEALLAVIAELRLLEQPWSRSTVVDEVRLGLHHSLDGLVFPRTTMSLLLP